MHTVPSIQIISVCVCLYQYIPSIMEVCLERLTRESKTVDMRRMCLQVVSLATLYVVYNMYVPQTSSTLCICIYVPQTSSTLCICIYVPHTSSTLCICIYVPHTLVVRCVYVYMYHILVGECRALLASWKKHATVSARIACPDLRGYSSLFTACTA